MTRETKVWWQEKVLPRQGLKSKETKTEKMNKERVKRDRGRGKWQEITWELELMEQTWYRTKVLPTFLPRISLSFVLSHYLTIEEKSPSVDRPLLQINYDSKVRLKWLTKSNKECHLSLFNGNKSCTYKSCTYKSCTYKSCTTIITHASSLSSF